MMESKQLLMELEAQNTKLSDRVEVSVTTALNMSYYIPADARAINPYSGRRK